MRHRLAAFAMLLLLAGHAHGEKPPPLGAEDAFAPHGKPPPLGAPDVVRPELRSGERPVQSGSGFLVAAGRVLTNNHVVAGCGRMTARNAQGRRAAARVDQTDPRRDLAVLTVPSDFGPNLTFRDSPPVERGEAVVTYGFPLSGLLSSGPTLTTGNVNALAGLRDNPLHFQISAPVQPGNSGGPLLDAQAHVIGVVVSKLNAARIAQMTNGDIPQNVNFAVKGGEALAFLAEAGATPTAATSDGPELRPAQIGEIANPSTVFLQCFR